MSSPILIVAHPGHELRLFSWLRRHRPMLCVLTDGSGGAAAARIDHTAAVIAACGAVRGPVFGARADRDWYADILAGDATPFHRAASAIAAAGTAGALVVADPVEGFNPMHDLAAAVADAVAAMLGGERRSYPLVNAATAGESWRLDKAEQAYKQAAVKAYAPLADEVASLLLRDPLALQEERLLPARFDWPAGLPAMPEYERIGTERIALGRYRETIRYGQHVRPIALALRGGG